jgi:hypothetical protein
MQQTMLLASERFPASGLYIVQDVCETPEDLQMPAFGVHGPPLRRGMRF